MMAHSTYSFGDSPSARVVAGAGGSRTKMGNLYLPSGQAANHLPDGQKHDLVVIPSSSAPAFGGTMICDFKEKNCVLHNLILQFNVSALTGLTGGTTPNFNPAAFWINHIDILIGGSIFQTVYGNELFLMTQVLENDEQRIAKNAVQGSYANPIQRNALSLTTNNYYVSIKSFIDQIKPTLLTDQHAIQLRVYFDTLTNNVNFSGATGTPIVSFNSCNLLARITRLDQSLSQYRLAEMSKMPFSSVSHETKLGTYIINTGTTQSSLILSAITGNVAALFFVVRPTASMSGTGYYTYSPISQFSILDSSSMNLVGGSPIPAGLAILLNSQWSKSSYATENYLATANSGIFANYYCWSFAADPISALKDGCSITTRRFNGSESLVITFPSATTQTMQVDVYGYCENVIQFSTSGVQKVSI